MVCFSIASKPIVPDKFATAYDLSIKLIGLSWLLTTLTLEKHLIS